MLTLKISRSTHLCLVPQVDQVLHHTVEAKHYHMSAPGDYTMHYLMSPVALIAHHVADHLRPELELEQRLAHLSGLKQDGQLGQGDGHHVAQLGQVHPVVKQLARILA